MKSISERVDKLIKKGKQLQIHLGNKWIDFDGENFELLKFHRSDIREKPEKEFILGDWWIPWPTAKPQKLTAENINNYNGTRPYAQNTEAKLWKPQPGEWCWLRGVGLVKILSIRDDSYTFLNLYKSTVYEIFKPHAHFEPFKGELPTDLKDN